MNPIMYFYMLNGQTRSNPFVDNSVTLATWGFSNQTYTSASYPNLTTVTGNGTFGSDLVLASISAPVMTSLGNDSTVDQTFINNCVKLTAFDLPNANNVSQLLFSYNFTGQDFTINLSNNSGIIWPYAKGAQNYILNIGENNGMIALSQGEFGAWATPPQPTAGGSLNSIVTIDFGGMDNKSNATVYNSWDYGMFANSIFIGCSINDAGLLALNSITGIITNSGGIMFYRNNYTGSFTWSGSIVNEATGSIEITENKWGALNFDIVTNDGNLYIQTNTLMASLNLSSLSSCNGTLYVSGNGILSINLSNLTTGDIGSINVTANSSLTTINLSASTSLATSPVFFDFTNNALSQASVDDILSKIDGWGRNDGELYLDGGSNASPTGGATNANYLSLVGRGWLVSIN